jgi:formate hydrogenlyase subunit 3/multisubunit Na+/H+ antiporter MnhD subunit
MSYFKKSAGTEPSPFLARLGALTWILIYAGLLVLVWGVWVEPRDEDTGWLMVAGGALSAVIGFLLVYVRSRIKD